MTQAAEEVMALSTKIAPHPLASFECGLSPGLYRIDWKSGGSSLAAIGMREDGTRWIAPTNWVNVGNDPAHDLWDDIDCATLLTRGGQDPRAEEEEFQPTADLKELWANYQAQKHLNILPEPSAEEIAIVAEAIQAKREELIHAPLNRIYPQLAEAALKAAMAVRKRNEG